MHDTILQIPTFHECAIETPSLRPFMPGNARGLPVVEELLRLTLGNYADKRLFGSAKFWKISNLLVTTPHLNDETQQISVAAVRRMRSLIDVSLSHHIAKPTEDIFITRVQSSRGAFEATVKNYDDFIVLLEKRGFRTVDASAISGEAYFETFSADEFYRSSRCRSSELHACPRGLPHRIGGSRPAALSEKSFWIDGRWGENSICANRSQKH